MFNPLPTVLLFAMGLVGCHLTEPQEKPEQLVQKAVEFPRAREIVTKYCVQCHYDQSTINRYDFQDDQEMIDQAGPIAERVRSGSMPPVGSPQLSKVERGELINWALRQGRINAEERKAQAENETEE